MTQIKNGGSCADLYTHHFGKNKQITFQMQWLDQRPWLAYSAHPVLKGGWCKTCLHFLNNKEKESLGIFNKTPFRNYNKSKEKMDGHSSTEYHKRALARSYTVRAQVANIENRIDTQMKSENKTILCHIVDAAILCAKQQIPLHEHQDHNIDFNNAPTENEGNFIVILRLLAESNPEHKKH